MRRTKLCRVRRALSTPARKKLCAH
ncbi:hypothetical protein J2T05_003884 [Cupriavidus necator]|nr:hypothetical protein [Cupriavidus necator]